MAPPPDPRPDAAPRKDSGASDGAGVAAATTREVYLKFLPHTCTEARLWEHFSECESLRNVRISMNKETGECKGIAWLQVGEAEDAEWLVNEWNEHPYNFMDGRHIEISSADTCESWKRPTARFDCRFGAACNRADCTFQHPAGWDPAVAGGSRGRFDRDCRFGVDCGRADCLFRHPAGWEPDRRAATKRACKLGRQCTFPGCFFRHPEGRDVDDAAACAEGAATVTQEPTTEERAKRKKSALAPTGEDADAAACVEVTSSGTRKKNLKKVAAVSEIADAGVGGETALPTLRKKKATKKPELADGEVALKWAQELTTQRVKTKMKKTTVLSASEHADAAARDEVTTSSGKRKKRLKAVAAVSGDAAAGVGNEPALPTRRKKRAKQKAEP